MKKELYFLALSVALMSCTSSPQNDCEKMVNNLLSQMTTAEKVEQLMQDAPANDRLGIPLMRYSESLHGLWLEGATVFPQAIAMGSTWEPELLTEMNGYVAKEARSIGVMHCYSPNLDVMIGDPRYGRIEESYGEDPYLVSRMGVAFINGLQGMGEERYDENHIIATAKHFAAYPENRTGINAAFADVSLRRMYEIHFPPFEAAIKEAKVGSLMPGHQDLNGIPCHMNEWLLQDVLRGDWGFDGFLISDNTDVSRLETMHFIARNRAEAAVLGIKAGVDMELVIGKHQEQMSYSMEVLADTLAQNPSLMQFVDRNVKNILTAKYRLGLFDDDYVAEENTTLVSSKEAQDCALKIAQKAVILLKNENDVLPFDKEKIRSIAVIGPNAGETIVHEGRIAQTGGYSGLPPYYTSIVEGIEAKADGDFKVNYAKGCDFLSDSKEGFAEAIAAARRSDVVVLAMGGSTQTCGEGGDRDDLDMMGAQNELVEAIAKLGKPTVMVLINGRPLTVEKQVEQVDGVIEGWYLGMRTGDAIADVLFGDYNPGGKLTVSIPRSIGQLPITYLLKPDFIGSGKGQYKNSAKEPLFSFGYGLSYTDFEYSNLKVAQESIKAGSSVKVLVDIKNVGDYDGEEVVQLYIRDDIATVGRYNKMLKGFERVAIKKGETRTVEFELTPDKFEMYDIDFNKVIEPGSFTIYVGSSSREEDLSSVKLNVI